MTQTKIKNIHTLERQIAAGRQRLQELWDIYGTTNSEVLNAGIKLDKLLNRYQRMIMK